MKRLFLVTLIALLTLGASAQQAANMNQIAKIANSRQEVPSMNYLRYVLAAVQNLKEESQPVFTSVREALHGNR